MRCIELFAGVGGFRLGLERNGHTVVWANEWDKYAAKIYDKNFEGNIDTRSIRDVPAEDIPIHDLICGGFPYQAFSIAGKRKGFDETRGTLFFEIMRIAQHHKTPYLFLENVKGLLNHDEGRTFEVILRTLDELGYDCQWQVLNSKDFGVPQNRERVFIIGHLRGEPRPKVFPLGGIEQQINETIKNDESGAQAIATRHLGRNGSLVSDVAGTLQSSDIPGIIQLNDRSVRDRDRVYAVNGVSGTITASEGGGKQPYILDGKPSSTRRGFVKEGYTGALETDGAQVVSRTVRSGGQGSPHGSRQNWDTYEVEGRVRRLTPLECERLQGFPDNWTLGESDTQRYKMMGNAVTVNVIEAIASHIKA